MDLSKRNTIQSNFSDRRALLKELRQKIQVAIEIEFATLPFYFYMYWSAYMHPDAENAPPRVKRSATLLKSIIMEEMFHFVTMCNVMTAIGGHPKLDAKHIPEYPTTLPGHSEVNNFEIHLEKLDLHSISTAIRIEMPAAEDAPPQGNLWSTIGQMYEYIYNLIRHPLLTDEDFNKGFQMNQWSGPSQIYLYQNHPVKDHEVKWFTIHCKQDALDAIDEIVAEGEGFEEGSLLESEGGHEKAHFYKFVEIYEHMGGYVPHDQLALFHNPKFLSELKTNDHFDADKYGEFMAYILPMVKDPKQHTGQYDPAGLQANSDFNSAYTNMIRQIEASFRTRNPGVIHFSPMFGLQTAAQAVISHQLKSGEQCGPSFEYVDDVKPFG